MDQYITQYYRKLLRSGFEHSGSLEMPTVFLDSVGEKIRICGNDVSNYMHVYIAIDEIIINDIKYLCMCDPTANVVVEILCELLSGLAVADAATLSAESIAAEIGTEDADFLLKAHGMLDLLHIGLARYADSLIRK